ncbi:O-methyltransferase [Mycena alexandri]|uniref:O-methyltransferase n=1 Tax=Mycena alexandri TaxID=1745969 RepID=A0AAD6WQ58_9AGAR|nr:O-methyltransferase [Mycena alexandri]
MLPPTMSNPLPPLPTTATTELPTPSTTTSTSTMGTSMSTPTFDLLRALHAILGDAIDDIQAVYAAQGPSSQSESVEDASASREPVPKSGHRKANSSSRAYASPPPSPGTTPSSSASTPTSASFSVSSTPSFAPPNSASTGLDFPSPTLSFSPHSPSEQLTSHPTVAAAINRIVAASAQLASIVQTPFLTLCDASMGYHLPACLRVVEAAGVVEVLREGSSTSKSGGEGKEGVHVKEIARRTGVDASKLAHILRLLATHHLLREVAPDVFAANRISSLLDSGKAVDELLRNPDRKYDGDDASAVGAFVGLCTDELFKSSAYLTEAVFPGQARLYPPGWSSPRFAPAHASPAPGYNAGPNGCGANASLTHAHIDGADPTRAPFNYAFGCGGVGYFAWLEGEGWASASASAILADSSASISAWNRKNEGEAGRGGQTTLAPLSPLSPSLPVDAATAVRGGKNANGDRRENEVVGEVGAGGVRGAVGGTGMSGGGDRHRHRHPNPNQFRLERFGKAMAGTGSWEAPGAVLHGFDWASLPRGSVVVDVGGGIGSTSMLLASAYAEVDGEDGTGGLRFVIQDRPVVVEMGEKAWRAKCPELLDSGAVRFQVHDFFTPQPITTAAVFLLRVVLHDWPDAFAQRILLRLREAAAPYTRLVLADFVLPLACVDDFGVGVDADGGGRSGVNGGDNGTENREKKDKGEKEPQVEGAEKMLAPAPLLANLGKASANAYWMDLTMQVTFNGQERTLRETVALALSAGWKVVRVTKAPGSLFGHIVAVPVAVPVPPQRRARAGSGSAFFDMAFGGGAGGSGSTYGAHGVGANGGASGGLEAGEMEREMEMVERASSRCGTPTFGSRVDLPSMAEARARFGPSVGGRRFGSGGVSGARGPPSSLPPLRQAAVLTAPPTRKKKPSPLSVVPPPSSPSPSLYRPVTSPRPPAQPAPQSQQLQSSPIARRVGQAPLFRSQQQQQQAQPLAPSPVPRQAPPPPSPMSPRLPLSRRASYAHLGQTVQLQGQSQSQSHGHSHTHSQSQPSPIPLPASPRPHAHTLRHVPSSPVLKQPYQQNQTQSQHQQHQQHLDPQPQSQASPPSLVPSRIPALTRRASHAQLQLPQTELRKRSGSIVHPAMVRAAAGGGSGGTYGHGLGSLLLNGRASGGALDFGVRRRDADAESEGDESRSGRASPVLLPARSVLAAAARIERGIVRSPSPDP